MYRFLPLIFLVAFANICSAQIADDFEFIDHRVRGAVHGESKVIGTDFLYVSHNQESWPMPMTSIILVHTLDNTVDTLVATFSSTSSIQEFSDGSFEIFINNLFDYDIGLPGFFSVEYDGANFDVNSRFTWDPESPVWDHYIYPQSIVRMEDDSYIYNSWEYTCRLNPDGVIDTLFEENFYGEFHQNDDREIFAYREKELYKFSETGYDLMLEFEKTIVDIENQGDFNDILFDGSLERWTADFSQKLLEWNLPAEITNFYQLEVDSFMVHALTTDANKFAIQAFESNELGPLIYENEYEDQGIKAFHDLEDSKFLLIGNDTLIDINYSAMFFRNVDVNQEIEYQSRPISIDSHEIFQYAKEDLFQYVNADGDSMFQTYYSAEMSLTFSNQSDTIVNEVDLKSKSLYDFFFYNGIDYYLDDLQLMPGESYTVQDTIIRTVSPDNFIVGIPGADFRFNHHANKIAYPDFTADFDDVSFDINLKLFPNPTTDILNIALDSEINSLEIFNSQGQLVLYKSFGSNLNRVDVSRFEAGSYFVRLRVKGEDGFAVHQFVKTD